MKWSHMETAGIFCWLTMSLLTVIKWAEKDNKQKTNKSMHSVLFQQINKLKHRCRASINTIICPYMQTPNALYLVLSDFAEVLFYQFIIYLNCRVTRGCSQHRPKLKLNIFLFVPQNTDLGHTSSGPTNSKLLHNCGLCEQKNKC